MEQYTDAHELKFPPGTMSSNGLKLGVSWMLKHPTKHHLKARAGKSSLTINNLSEIGKIQ